MAHRIALALQGGGAHGAFTWGVLHRLLDEVAAGRLEIVALSGSSAGAINGALCAYGLSNGSPKDSAAFTQELLALLWETLSEQALLRGNPFSSLPIPGYFNGWNIDWTPIAFALDIAALFFSPYDTPLYANPLAELLGKLLPPSALGTLNSAKGPAFHVCAVDVGSNQRMIFTQPHISRDVLLASACLPTQFRAVGIENHMYWDGGYIGNPALDPLIRSCDDIVAVLLNPLRITDIPPRSARQILDRLNEITFNAPFVLEVNAIQAVNKLLGKLKPEQIKDLGYRHVHLHLIRNEVFSRTLGRVSKDNLSPAFVRELFDIGKETASVWLADHFHKLGRESSCSWKSGSFNLDKDYIEPHLKPHRGGAWRSEPENAVQVPITSYAGSTS